MHVNLSFNQDSRPRTIFYLVSYLYAKVLLHEIRVFPLEFHKARIKSKLFRHGT